MIYFIIRYLPKKLKFITARIFGKKIVTYDITQEATCKAVMYELKGVTYVKSIR